jgi:ABC-type glycerol-3-phosphate transport system substrate-binding protein
MTASRVRSRLFVLATVVVLVGAACSSKKGGNTNSPAPSGGPNLSGQKIEVAAEWTGPEQASFTQVIKAFEDSTHAKVSYTSTGNDTATIIGTRIDGGNPPDVALLPQPGLMNDFASRNALIPIEDVAGSLVDANYSPDWRTLGSVNGKLYGVWFKAANKSTFWYNTHVLQDAGVQPPTSWDELLTDAQTISDSGVTPYSIGGGDGWTLTDWFENVYIRTAGPDMYDQLTTHQIKWTDPSVKTALTTLAQVFGKPDLIAGGPSGALQTLFPSSVDQVFAKPPKAGLVYEGDFVAGEITGATSSKLGTDANFFDFPAINGSAPAVVGGGDMAVLLKDSAAGKAFIKYLASPQAAEIWARLGGFTSPNKGVDLSVYTDDITRRSAQALTSAQTFRFDMSDLEPAAFGGTPGQGEWKILQDFLRDPSNIDGTTSALEDAASKAFASS